MTVEELIQELSRWPKDMHVAVNGYEGGATEHIGISVEKVYANANDANYLGEHELLRDERSGKTGEVREVLLLSRYS